MATLAAFCTAIVSSPRLFLAAEAVVAPVPPELIAKAVTNPVITPPVMVILFATPLPMDPPVICTLLIVPPVMFTALAFCWLMVGKALA